MRHLIPVVLLLAAGCASTSGVRWLKEDIHPVAVRGDRRLDRVKLWTHTGVQQWHAVLVTRDSISGIPDTAPSQCDSCRVTLPTSAVDSLHVGYRQDGPDNPFASDLGIIALILAGLLVP